MSNEDPAASAHSQRLPEEEPEAAADSADLLNGSAATENGSSAAGTDGAAAGEDESTTDEPDQNDWKQVLPWRGKGTGLDKLLLFIILAVPLIYMALLPLRPWMLVNAPVLQEFINGAKTAIVAAAAYARVGEIPLWLVVFAGFVGMAKFDWAFWLAGKRWGDGILRLFASNERQRRRIEQLKRIPAWALFLMTFISRTPGVPGTLVWLVAGWNGMRLWLFLLADLAGAMMFTIIWTVLGYQLGQAAVDVLAVIDRYTLWVTFGFIGIMIAWVFFSEYRKERASGKPAVEDVEADADEDADADKTS